MHNLDWRVRDSGEMFAPMVSMDNHTAKGVHLSLSKTMCANRSQEYHP